MNMKILLVEDEAELSESIAGFLKEEGYICETSASFDDAILKIGVYDYDCLLIDLTLPGGNGLEIIDAYKKQGSRGGIIIISARNSLDDKIRGLELGADDYLTKPFHLHELNARVKSLYRRMNFSGSRIIKFMEITVDPESKEVQVNGHTVVLTKKEYEILLYLLQNPKRVLSKASIAEHLWGDHMDLADSYDFIYSQIKNLRKKINEYSSTEYIHAIYGVGYKLIRS
jgi:DNA-binding response OmpR family regulator